MSIVVLIALVGVGSVFAQDDTCALLFQEVVNTIQQSCLDTGVNQVCYGYGAASPDPRPNIRLVWHEPGDIVDTSALAGFTTSGFDPASG
ncbi:MAG: hypothetical protein K8I60_16675, partial [Anaerolineae bacterium]|nr:hypothetical protein [Anaerolineae bacterium]